MSPEQARGSRVDYRADQFSLGSILYEMVTGQRAFKRETHVQTLAAIIETEPAPISTLNPSVPPPFRWIIERCLKKSPSERYASTLDLARDLRQVRDHLEEAVTPPGGLGSGPVVAPPPRRTRFGLAVAGVAVLALLGGALAGRVGSLLRPPLPEQKQLAVLAAVLGRLGRGVEPGVR